MHVSTYSIHRPTCWVIWMPQVWPLADNILSFSLSHLWHCGYRAVFDSRLRGIFQDGEAGLPGRSMVLCQAGNIVSHLLHMSPAHVHICQQEGLATYIFFFSFFCLFTHKESQCRHRQFHQSSLDIYPSERPLAR